MPFTVDIEVTKRIDVSHDYDRVFDTLADVPYSAEEFPKLQKLVDLGDEVYRWIMEPITLAAYTAQTRYACAYTWDKEEGWIAWAPVDDEGSTATIEGRWDIEKRDDGELALKFTTSGEITLPFPSLAKVIVAPLAAREFEQLVGKYLKNLQRLWDELED